MSGNFFMINNDIFKCGLKAYEFKVYAYLVMKADRDTMTCYPAVSKIANECGMSKSQVHKVTASLENKGLISKIARYKDTANGKKHQTSSLYHIEPLPTQYGGSASVLNTHSLYDKEGK